MRSTFQPQKIVGIDSVGILSFNMYLGLKQKPVKGIMDQLLRDICQLMCLTDKIILQVIVCPLRIEWLNLCHMALFKRNSEQGSMPSLRAILSHVLNPSPTSGSMSR